MKLHTQVSGFPDDAMVIYDADCGLSPDKQAEHDLLALHALLQAMEEQLSTHFSVVSDPAKKALRDASKRAAEILAGWMGEDRG